MSEYSVSEDYDLLEYLRGRAFVLKADLSTWESGSMKERTTQARLYEITEIIKLLEFSRLKKKGEIK